MISNFSLSVLESLAKNLGDTANGFTGTDIGRLLHECDFPDPLAGGTKWKRLYVAFVDKQKQDRCANNICVFLEHALSPARYVSNQDWYADMLHQVNQTLSFEGMKLDDDGKLRKVSRTNTISEAKARASKLRESLRARNVHPDVFKFCREELLVDNYFHAVFEATKSVAEKIRDKTGLKTDGSLLVDEAFAFKKVIPHLALNSLQSESEQSEQKGFMNLLKGLFGTFRNTTAHAPKIKWDISEQDALDILSLVSLVHRRLDDAIEARKIYQQNI